MPRLTAAELRSTLSTRLAPALAHATIGLAVSGGADSLALLVLASHWVRTRHEAPRIIIYTVDHGLRPEAASETRLVARIAASLDFPCRMLRWQGEKPATGVQAAARTARYRLIGEAMRSDGATLLLTAHHADDQAETILMRLAHGSGLAGLRGMDRVSEVEGIAVFRPLLDVPHAALQEVVDEAGLAPAIDPSNTDPHYERVRWRQAAPALADLGLDAERLATFARRAGEADAALSQWADQRFADLVAFDGLGAAELPLAAFAQLPRPIGVRLLGKVLETVGGSQRPRALGAVEDLRDRLAAGATSPTTALGVSILQRGETLWFSRERGRKPAPPDTVPPAATLLWDRRFTIANASPEAIDVRMAGLSRMAAEKAVGRSLSSPAAAIRTAPLVTAADGRLLALGCYRFSDRITVAFRGQSATFSSM